MISNQPQTTKESLEHKLRTVKLPKRSKVPGFVQSRTSTKMSTLSSSVINMLIQYGRLKIQPRGYIHLCNAFFLLFEKKAKVLINKVLIVFIDQIDWVKKEF